MNVKVLCLIVLKAVRKLKMIINGCCMNSTEEKKSYIPPAMDVIDVRCQSPLMESSFNGGFGYNDHEEKDYLA